MLKDDFKGRGSLTELVEQFNSISRSLNNIDVKMPTGYGGTPATARIEDGTLVIDMTDVDFSA